MRAWFVVRKHDADGLFWSRSGQADGRHSGVPFGLERRGVAGSMQPRRHDDLTSAPTIGVRMDPTRSISTVTSSPGWRRRGGRRVYPTPLGVPVTTRSPGYRVIVSLR